jgi:hypothetical protein
MAVTTEHTASSADITGTLASYMAKARFEVWPH